MILKDVGVSKEKEYAYAHVFTFQDKKYVRTSFLNVIYKITSTTSEEFYIGSSYRPFERFRQHREALKGGFHANRHLQNIFNKHGSDSLVIEIIEVLPDEFSRSDLYKREQELLDELKPSLNHAKTVEVKDCAIHVEVHQYDLQGNYVASFPSFIEASSHMMVVPSAIRQAEIGGTMVKNFRWSRVKVDSMPKAKLVGAPFWLTCKYLIHRYTDGVLVGSWDSRIKFLEDNPECDWSDVKKCTKDNSRIHRSSKFTLEVFDD